MARFKTEGLQELIDDMEEMGQTTGDLAQKMLLAGAEEIKISWKKAVEIHKVKLTGQTLNSIDYSRSPKKTGDILSIDIYPQGYSTYTISNGIRYRRKTPVRNAEVAFVNHYGTRKHPGTFFVDTADDLSGPAVEKVCTDIWDTWLGKNGFAKEGK